jgi:hypothetical protein
MLVIGGVGLEGNSRNGVTLDGLGFLDDAGTWALHYYVVY